MDDRRLVALIGYGVAFSVFLYLWTRPRVLEMTREILPAPGEIDKVIRRAQEITRKAVKAGKEGPS